MIDRKLETVYTPEDQPGFLGSGHTARPVIQVDFTKSDPFIMLMDDMLDKKDTKPAGGPHPHAGFETVTLVLEGEIGDGDHALKSGDFEMMTAGRGIVHTEIISKPTRMRILQLWLNLPKEKRNALPRLQRLAAEHVPAKNSDGADIKVYSGSFAGMTSPVKNHTSLILAKIKLQPGTCLAEALPGNFSTFLYVLDGSVQVGEEKRKIAKDQVGWLNQVADVETQLRLRAGENGAYLVLYAAEPQHHEIVSHGPFIADSMEDIRQLYADFRAGKMGHISEVAEEQQFAY
ncbi:MAG TPA: pirin-like C-terminal cupin domain-containing protein [Chryseosolibacter sp.]